MGVCELNTCVKKYENPKCTRDINIERSLTQSATSNREKINQIEEVKTQVLTLKGVNGE